MNFYKYLSILILIPVLVYGKINDELAPYDNIIETRLGDPDVYWEWDNEPVWLNGVDWGGITFFESIGYGIDFLGSTLNPEDAISVEIRLDTWTRSPKHMYPCHRACCLSTVPNRRRQCP